jgi:hypothetical protein
MWIEKEIQKDADSIQKTMEHLSRDYKAQLPRTIVSRIPVLHNDDVNDFIATFYHKLRNAEYEIYKMSCSSEPNRGDGDITMNLPYKITEINNSANDLPHPRILSELQRSYDVRRHRSGSGSDGEDDRYIPYKVYQYIREKSELCIQFQTTIQRRAITLYFITFPESHVSVVCSKSASSSSSSTCSLEIATYQQYAYKVFAWLYIVTSMSDKDCSEESLNVYFYMTPFKKHRPARGATGDDAILSAIHVNTGLTRNCETHGEIVVYRTEEWFKVFVHESMHNFNMDFIDQDLRDANTQLRRTFCIPHEDVLLFETYTETWARIINTMFHTYFHDNDNDHHHVTQKHFIRTVREKLAHNAMFYAYQVVKVLEIMKLNYGNITIQSTENTEICRRRYAEDTNVYAYYILGGVLSIYALPFISWCCENNRGTGGRITAIRFSRQTGALPKLMDFISHMARDPVILSMIAFIEKATGAAGTVATKTMRMTMD